MTTDTQPAWVERDFVMTTHGPYFKPGRYFVEQRLFDWWIAENRSPRAVHNFVATGERYLIDESEPFWGQQLPVTCTRCGDKRTIWPHVDKADLNYGWCVDRTPAMVNSSKGFLRRLFGGAR